MFKLLFTLMATLITIGALVLIIAYAIVGYSDSIRRYITKLINGDNTIV